MSQVAPRWVGPAGHYMSSEMVRLELYRLLSTVLATQPIAALTEDVLTDPFAALMDACFEDEFSALFLSVAIKLQIYDEHHGGRLRRAEAVCGHVINPGGVPPEEPLTLTAACRHILQSRTFRAEIEPGDGIYENNAYVKPMVSLEGCYPNGNAWHATLDLLAFVRGCLEVARY